MRARRLIIGSTGALLAAALLSPAGASAHGLIQRANLPIPEWLFGWAAAIVLVVSFVALAVLWPKPRLEGAEDWRALPWGIGRFFGRRGVELACGAIGVLLFALTIVAGLAGEQVALHNFAPVFIFITFWVGMALASALLGDVFRAFNPWRAIGRTMGWLAARTPLGRSYHPRACSASRGWSSRRQGSASSPARWRGLPAPTASCSSRA